MTTIIVCDHCGNARKPEDLLAYERHICKGCIEKANAEAKAKSISEQKQKEVKK